MYINLYPTKLIKYISYRIEVVGRGSGLKLLTFV